MPFTEVNGKSIFYSWKPASRAGLTLYFIHGLGASHSYWAPCIPGLVAAGFSCLAIDVAGKLKPLKTTKKTNHTFSYVVCMV